jgi:hypothetical protein
MLCRGSLHVEIQISHLLCSSMAVIRQMLWYRETHFRIIRMSSSVWSSPAQWFFVPSPPGLIIMSALDACRPLCARPHFKHEIELLYDWRITANQFFLAPSPLRLTTRDSFVLQLNPWAHSLYVTSFLTRGWVWSINYFYKILNISVRTSQETRCVWCEVHTGDTETYPAALPYHRYPSDRRLGGPQSLFGRRGEDKILDPTGTRTPTPLSSSPYPVAIRTSQICFLPHRKFIASPIRRLNCHCFYECNRFILRK